MEKIEEGDNKGNGYINEAFQIETFNSDLKENNFISQKSPEDSKDTKKVSILSVKSEKAEWGGGLEFLMACIATSVGLGNVWRFPFTAYENGGGAFLIPYIIVLLIIGKPFYFLEGLLGQFSNKSCVKLWAMVPAMKGLGYGQVLAGFCVVSYYSALMALTLFYLFASFQSVLPWAYCRDEWRGQCIDINSTAKDDSEKNFAAGSANSTLMSSAELYFRRVVLEEQDSIESGIGAPSWQLSICLLLSWICIFGVLCRGVKSTGKAAYFLALFPYVVMIALLIRAVTLEGAVEGILFFVTPKWDKLWLPSVWYAAITQCFFSLSVCFGPILTYSSYNNFGHKVDRDVMIVTSLDTVTSLMAGFTIFGILGNLAHEMGVHDISKVVRGGTGLAFISYPDALSRFTVVPQLFSVLFFIMMFVLGTGSAVALSAAVFRVLCDHFPKVAQWKIVLMLSVFGFLISLIYVTPGGQWFITLVDYYGGTFVAIVVGVLEMVAVFWMYGLHNFLNDMEFMLGSRPSFYWRICWLLITPLLMIVILFYTIATYQAPTYDGMSFPTYAYVIGWILVALGIAEILGWMIYKLMENRSSSITETFKAAFRPSKEKFGPKDPKIRKDWEEFKENKKFQQQTGLIATFFR